MFCTTCGVENANDVRFCYSCGSATRLPTSQAPAPGPAVPTAGARSVPTTTTYPHEARDLGPSHLAPAASAGYIAPISTTERPPTRVYVNQASGTVGQWTLEQLRRALAEGRVSPTNLGRYEGSTEPKTVSELLTSLSPSPSPRHPKRFLGNTRMNVGIVFELLALLLLIADRHLIPFLAFLLAGALLYRSGKRQLDRESPGIATASESTSNPPAKTSESGVIAPQHASRP